jgi:hypothetical protein
VTLVLTVNGLESIWLLADRRLSFKTRAPRDDARKVMFLETADGVAILGYAGLGATAHGTEPADWMRAVLRGQNLPLEQSLGVIAEAMKKQFPRHLVQMPGINGPVHNVIVTSFVGNETRLYTIDLALSPDRKRYQFRYTRWQQTNLDSTTKRTPKFGLGGTGGIFLYNNKNWIRGLLQLVNANDHRQISDLVVADHLASLNYKVHSGIDDNSVGPRCIVAWRHRKEGIHKGGGGHQFYTERIRDTNSPSLPTIGNGMDIEAITGILMPHMAKMFEGIKEGEPVKDLDKDKLNAELARLPDTPDENLR